MKSADDYWREHATNGMLEPIEYCSEGNCLEWRGDMYQCDWPMGRGKTCDAILCDDHAFQIAEEKHLCPIHRAIFEATGVMTPIRTEKLRLAKAAGPVSAEE